MHGMSDTLTILGIETSCDETAAAVLRLTDGRAELVSDVIRTQLDEHAPYLGVVPEIAARAHAELADLTVKAAMHEAGIGYEDLDGVAATSGPGLIGGVLVGMMTGKAIAQAAGKPFVAVNLHIRPGDTLGLKDDFLAAVTATVASFGRIENQKEFRTPYLYEIRYVTARENSKDQNW